MSEVFVSTADEIHVDVVIEAFEAIVGIEVGVQGPQGPRGVPGPVGPFDEGAILTGAGAGNPHSSLATVNSVGDLVAASYVATAAGLDGGYWWYGPPGENWVWYATDGVARLGRDATGPITDVISIDYATGAITAAGDFTAASYVATAAGTAGGFWWYGPPGENWAWYGEAGIARLGRFDGAGAPVGDALTINYTTGIVSLPNGATAPTPAPGDNDTSVATTAFVQAALAAGGAGISQLTGDVTAGPGSGSQAASLATVNANVGTFQGLTLDGKGRVTAASNQSYLAANQTITLSGDLTGSGTVSINAQIAANAVGTTEIAAANVTYAKIQNVIAARLLGNPTGSSAAPSEISLGTNLSFAGAVLNATGGGASGLSGMTAGQIPIAATATTVTSSGNLSGDVTSNATLVTTIANGAVTYAKQQNVTAARLIGNPTGGTAAHSEISLGTNLSFAGSVLNATGAGSGLSGMVAGQIPIAATATTVTSSGNLSGAVTTAGSLATTLANNAVATANITNANVTYAKIQNVAANRILGNATGSAAAPAEIALPLAVANGGTGSATAALARTALGAVNIAGDAMTGNLSTTGTLAVGLASVSAGSFESLGAIGSTTGYRFRSGTAGPYQANVQNIQWIGGTGAHLWVDASDAGLITITCDYRLKENIAPLASTWDKVKALRPISYTAKENEELRWATDPAERWGLIAHELQETLLPTAATATKDAPHRIQSPDIMALAAALTRALQEAMARIEALEGAAPA